MPAILITRYIGPPRPPLTRLLSLFLPGHLLAYTVALSISSTEVIRRTPRLDRSVVKIVTDALHHLTAKLASSLLCLLHNIIRHTSLCSSA